MSYARDILDIRLLRYHKTKREDLLRLAKWMKLEHNPNPTKEELAIRIYVAAMNEEVGEAPPTKRM